MSADNVPMMAAHTGIETQMCGSESIRIHQSLFKTMPNIWGMAQEGP